MFVRIALDFALFSCIPNPKSYLTRKKMFERHSSIMHTKFLPKKIMHTKFLSWLLFSSACGSTWDLICYIEKFCVANLLKMVVVLALFYIGEFRWLTWGAENTMCMHPATDWNIQDFIWIIAILFTLFGIVQSRNPIVWCLVEITNLPNLCH